MPKVKELGVTVVPQQFAPNEIGGGAACMQSFCAGGTMCSDCTTQQFSICGTTPGPCTDCTTQQFSICGGTYQQCSDCTRIPFSICGTTPGPCFGCSRQITLCANATCNNISWVACRLGSRFPTVFDVTTPCGGSVDPTIRQPGGGLRREDIAQLRSALQAQMQALDEQEKAMGPQSVEEIDAREKEINAELERLKGLRSEFKKK